ncbi:hypothetical protein CEE36_10220 [candidate division TA06 bacterium B3_TA06]|uniref:Peptidase M10 metallopeptidase domain-containing protein n=1 Tax=candidate division TA06 bacterium B3_TA06 TaxID=2012487 RepID=A0A532UXJ6_UNCT6|nr:MAG: hypothetical protein CEE36_10220 [candidate division TA06 bacterium B3_TA06]
MKRIRLIILAIVSLPLVTVLSGYYTSGWQWPIGVTVTYRIHQGGYPDWHDAIERAFETWSNVSTADIGFLCLGTMSDPPQFPNSECEVCFVGSGWEYISSDPQLVAVSLTDEEYGTTQEVDLFFNDQYHNWSTNGAYQTFDVEHVAAHEAGHWVGLDEQLVDPLTTMHQEMNWYETYKRDLHSDDIAGASFLYPYQVTWAPELDAISAAYHQFNADVAISWDPTGKEVYVHMAYLEGENFGPGCYEDTTGQILDLIVTPVRVIYVPNGIGWGQKEILSDWHFAISGPHIEIDGEDNVHAIWVEHDINPGDFKVIYRKRDGQTGTWGWPIELRHRDSYVSWPTIAVAHAPTALGQYHDDMVYAAWVERDESKDDDNLVFARSHNNGDSWDTPYQIEENDMIGVPKLALDSTAGVHLVWIERIDGDYYDYLCWKKNTFEGAPGSYWKTKVAKQRFRMGAPSVAIDGYGYVHIASALIVGPNDERVFYDRISNLGGSGSTWDSLGPISPAQESAENPHVVCDNLGFVHLFWDDTRYHDPNSNPRETDMFYSRNFHMGDDWYWEYPKDGRKIYILPPYSSPYVYVSDVAQPDTFGDLFVGADVKWPNFDNNWDVYATLGREDDGVREFPWPPGQAASFMAVEEENPLDTEPQGCYLSASINRLFYFAPSEALLTCYSIDGRRVWEEKIKGAGQLELDFLPSGTYFAHLKSKDGSSSKIRVVVIR